MYIKINEVTHQDFFKTSEHTIFSACNVDLQVIPVKGDKIFINDTSYKVLQRDIHFVDGFDKQHITLFVEKT